MFYEVNKTLPSFSEQSHFYVFLLFQMLEAVSAGFIASIMDLISGNYVEVSLPLFVFLLLIECSCLYDVVTEECG